MVWTGLPSRQVNNASLVGFRILFGLVGLVSAARFVWNDWVTRCFETPTYFFSYYGLEFIQPLNVGWMYTLFAIVAISALGIIFGAFYRVATVTFFLSFTYIELIDVTNYLNHYYLVSVLAFLLCFLPLNRRFSVDAWRKGIEETTIDSTVLYLIRFQVALVYVFAAVAKLTTDWMVHAHPLSIWLRARVDTPFIGWLFEYPETAFLMSWGGFLFDATIVFWLLNKKTRVPAYVVLVGFHFMTGVLFQIGMFPWIMVTSATIFFAPTWCERWFRAAGTQRAGTFRFSNAGLVLIGIWCLFHVLFPLRTFAHSQNVNWSEQGMRWSWRVMVREKKGAVTYRVVDLNTGREKIVPPTRLLTRHQTQEFSGQPDLIARLGQEIGRREAAKQPDAHIAVFADAIVSLNGRPPQPIIDPSFDLMDFEDYVFSPPSWILDAPAHPLR